jgi:hypothetical protein
MKPLGELKRCAATRLASLESGEPSDSLMREQA